MLHASADLLQTFTVFDVFDPDELGDDSRVSGKFLGYNNLNTYRLRERGIHSARSTGLLSRLAVRREGTLTISYIASRFGTDVGIVGEGVRRLFLTFSLSGSIALHGRADHAAVPEVDWAAPAVAPITRLVQHLIKEVADPAGLFSLQAALETFSDTLVHAVLGRLPHSYSERLQAPRSPAIPRQLRRAEAFMAAHSGQPISIADVAAAAGCGARALQLAFWQFRDTTPLAALHEVRLQAVRAALRTSDAPASVIAREFGFSNASRFCTAFRRRFGEPPPEEC